MQDIANQRFGQLTAIECCWVDSGGNAMWSCRCDCGNLTTVRGSHLRSGHVSSCGGKGHRCRIVTGEDLTGMVFGRLTVLGPNGFTVYKSQRVSRWDCRCECGKTVNVRRPQLVRNKTRSCGCLSRETTAKRSTKHGLHDTCEYRLYHSAKSRAKKFGVPFNLDLGDIVIPKMCPLLGVELRPNKRNISPCSPTLDRIIPQRGYIKGNVWIICQKANQMKSDLSPEQLKNFFRVIEDKLAAMEQTSDAQ